MFLRRTIEYFWSYFTNTTNTSVYMGACTSTSKKRKTIKAPATPASNHSGKYKREPIPAKTRDEVWEKYHQNKLTGICYCCNETIFRDHGGWHCAHVIAEVKGGKTEIDNLRTCCGHCNLSMGDQNLYTYMRDKGLTGPGAKNIKAYLKKHPEQTHDRRSNNWRKSGGKFLMMYMLCKKHSHIELLLTLCSFSYVIY